jgi:hypothetical protein
MAGLKVYDGSIWRATGVEDSYWDILTASPASQTVNLSWPPAGGSPTSYELSVNNVVQNIGSVTSFSPTGLSIGVSYQFKVRPVFSDGSTGGWSYFKDGGPLGFNDATGGTETTVSNYNGTGETWKVHTFTSSGTFTVSTSSEDFRVLVVGSGGGGGYCANSLFGGGGGAGRMIEDNARSISGGTHSIVIGNVGGNGATGTATTFNGISAPAGGNGGNQSGGAGQNGGSGGGGGGTFGSDTTFGLNVAGTPIAGYGNNGATSRGSPQTQSGGGGGAGSAGGISGNAGQGRSNNITGASITYAVGGGWGSASGTNGRGNGGSGSQTNGLYGGVGGKGTVIVSYRIG